MYDVLALISFVPIVCNSSSEKIENISTALLCAGTARFHSVGILFLFSSQDSIPLRAVIQRMNMNNTEGSYGEGIDCRPFIQQRELTAEQQKREACVFGGGYRLPKVPLDIAD